jgi:hypothetical protein
VAGRVAPPGSAAGQHRAIGTPSKGERSAGRRGLRLNPPWSTLAAIVTTWASYLAAIAIRNHDEQRADRRRKISGQHK